MKNIIMALMSLLLCCASCKKSDESTSPNINWVNKMNALYAHNAQKVTVKEGVYGTLILLKGNCMPVLDSNSTTCTEAPVQRNVYIYTYTKSNQVVSTGNSTYSEIKSQLKAIIKTDNEGFFELEVEPGMYSVFIEEQGALYANGFDGSGGINPVTVYSGKVTEGNQKIIYAVY